MSRRPLNELETRLHQAALSASKNELSVKQAEGIISDPSARQDALNFLLGVGLFKSLVDAKGAVSFRAVTKNELTATKDLNVDENLVLGHIKGSKNEGIWTKHLKAKTNLHQTVIDRCLKTLTQKRLIKRVPSVQHPTRKIYMLEGLDPSVALTGGPWYTDNELDTEFIQHLTEACLKFIRDLSFPKRRGGGTGDALYGLSNSPDYPSAEKIRNSLRKARLTETDLSVEHVEMLLNVLVLDGEIERLPSFGISMWDANIGDDDSGDDSDGRTSKKKRKHSNDDRGSSRRKRSRKSNSSDEEDSSSDDTSQRKSKRKRTRIGSDSDEESDADISTRKKKKKKNKGKGKHDSDSSDSNEDEDTTKKRKKSKSKKSKDSSSDSDDSSDEESGHRSRRGKSSKATRRSPPPVQAWNELLISGSGGHVYRAIKQERLSFGFSEAPCTQCPSFEFCKDDGPVNPRGCVYYGDWVTGGTIAAIEESV